MKTRSLFTPICAFDQLNEDFLLVSNHLGYIPGKNELLETFSYHPNPDGNFVEQFQSKNGFSARVWELYLLAFFLDAGFGVNCDDDSPDFFISNRIEEIAVEAVTTNEGKDKEIFIKNDEQHRAFVAQKIGQQSIF